ncbi:MAG: hypothetical protein CMJ58_16960 [Planctomycetaceae bacterium]|nr:hypothetical protein [Planctomycetaceae bacterium]
MNLKLTPGVQDAIDLMTELNDEDLDCLQATYCSNELADSLSPWLQKWLLRLLGEERNRRRADADTADFTFVDFGQWPLGELIGTAALSIEALECIATAAYRPTLTAFGTTLAKVLIAEMASRLLTSARA